MMDVQRQALGDGGGFLICLTKSKEPNSKRKAKQTKQNKTTQTQNIKKNKLTKQQHKYQAKQ